MSVIEVTCGLPQSFARLIDAGDDTAAQPVLSEMRSNVKTVDGLSGKRKVILAQASGTR